MTESLEVSIVMPCLNEAETLERCILEAFAALSRHGVRGEVLVADNGSVDGSVEIALNAGARVVHVAQKGYGSALRGGILEARGKYILMGDADGSYDFGQLDLFLDRLRQGDDLVMGCRLPRGGGRIEPGAMPWKHRWIGNPVLTRLGKLFFSSAVDDFHCGLRAFNRKSVLDLDLRTSGMEFASEMVVKATLAGLRLNQVPVTLRPDGRSRSPHLRSWRDGWRHMRFMLLYSPKWLFIIPGLILTLIGAAGFVLLFDRPLTIGAVTFDLNSLLVSSTATLVGLQVLFFGIFVKAYAVNIGLLPGKTYWLQLVRGRSAEWGILVGLVFMLTGLGLILKLVLVWKATGFGPLPVQESMRTVILAVTVVGIGIQAMVSGFALNILGLNRSEPVCATCTD